MFAPFVHFASVDLQADAQVTFRAGNVDVSDYQRLGVKIKNDFRLVSSRAAIRWIVCALQKAELACEELAWPESHERLKTASVECANFARGRQVFLWRRFLGRKFEFEMAAIVSQRGVLLVGRINEGAADGFVCDSVEDRAMHGGRGIG